MRHHLSSLRACGTRLACAVPVAFALLSPPRQPRPWPRRRPAASATAADGTALLRHDPGADRRRAWTAAPPGTPGNSAARAWIVKRFAGPRPGAGANGADFDVTFSFTIEGRRDDAGVNVVGAVSGRRPELPVLVVSAHYDHLGIRDGQTYHGADDNASGVAMLLAVAERCVATPFAHTLVLAALDAEEQGLQGAKALVASPPIARDRIALNVNFDMVSRSDRREIYVAGPGRWPALLPLLKAPAARAPITVKFGHDTGGGQDDWTHAVGPRGVPRGGHPVRLPRGGRPRRLSQAHRHRRQDRPRASSAASPPSCSMPRCARQRCRPTGSRPRMPQAAVRTAAGAGLLALKPGARSALRSVQPHPFHARSDLDGAPLQRAGRPGDRRVPGLGAGLRAGAERVADRGRGARGDGGRHRRPVRPRVHAATSASAFDGLGHRWIRSRDLAALVWLLHQMVRDHGSIEGFFAAGQPPATTRSRPDSSRSRPARWPSTCGPIYGRAPADAGRRLFLLAAVVGRGLQAPQPVPALGRAPATPSTSGCGRPCGRRSSSSRSTPTSFVSAAVSA